MRDMNILNEIDDFKRLSGLLTESVGGVVARLKRVPWIDDLLTPAVRASDSETGRIASKIDGGGLRSLTDDELLFILKKLPAEEVAQKLIKGNVFFTEAQVKSNLQGFLNDLTQGNKTWDEIEQLLTDENSLRQLWGQSASPMTDDVYEGLEDILNEVGQKYLDDIEDFIRKNGSDSAKAKLPKESFLGSLGRKIGVKLENRFLARQRFILGVLMRTTKGMDSLIKERDLVFQKLQEKIAKGGHRNADITAEIRKLAELATATNKFNQEAADIVFNDWISKAGLTTAELRQISRNKWKKEWLESVREYASDKSLLQGVNDYWKAYTRLVPLGKKMGLTNEGSAEFWKRWSNMIVYATPIKRTELMARLANKGMARVGLERLVGNLIQTTLIAPVYLGLIAAVTSIFTGDDRQPLLDTIKEKYRQEKYIAPLTITYLDNVIDGGIDAYQFLGTNTGADVAQAMGGEVWVDYQTAAQILSGDYIDDGVDSSNAKSNGVRRYIKKKYSDIPNDYLLRIGVTNNNKVYFTQIRGGNRTQIPLALINGEIYLINKQANKKIRFDKIWTLNEGLINILKEQEIDWGSGEPIDDNIDLDTVDDVTTSDWSEIVGLGGDEDGDSSGSEEDGDSGIDLSFLGGTGSSGTKWEFNRNPTGQLKSDRDAARLDADGYTKGNIYVYKNPDGNEELVLAGKLAGGTPHLFKVEKNESGKWGWINDSQDPPMWEDFKDY